MTRRSLLNNLLMAVLLCTLAFIVFFQVDIFVSMLFFNGKIFPLSAVEWLRDVRDLYMIICWIIILHIAALFCFQTKIVTQIPAWVYGFITLCAALGPGLLVNGIMKAYLGRARPYQVDIFGGDASFTPPLPFPVGQCATNCSLVSGEAASAFMMIIILWLIFCQPLHKNIHRTILVALVFAPMAVLRIMVGRHFLSDVLLAGLLMGVVVVAVMIWQQRLFREFRTTPNALFEDVIALWRYILRLPFTRHKRDNQDVSKT